MPEVNMFLIFLASSAVLIALFGFFTRLCYQRGIPHTEKVFRCLCSSIMAGMFFLLIIVTNYVLCSTALKRIIKSELISKDELAGWIFSGSGIKTNNILALVIVISSFVGVGCFILYLSQLVKHIKNRSWHMDIAGFIVFCLTFTVIVLLTCVFLYCDTSLMIFRTAILLNSGAYDGLPASWPDPFRIISQHRGTMMSFLLVILFLAYPLFIIISEFNLASASARFNEACREEALAKEEAQNAVMPQVQIPVTPFIAPMPPQGAAPNVPGGRFVAPIPFARAGNGGNGRTNREV